MSNRRGDRRTATNTRALGRLGEDIAERYLQCQGVRILARNVYLRYAELDLVGVEGDVLCFIEVRMRSSARFGHAAESVDARKRRRITRAAAELLASGELPRVGRIRFDVLAIDGEPAAPRITHIRDAFQNDR